MSQQKFFDFSKIIGEEMEVLLTRLKSLIGAKKITDNLPDNLQGEIDEINDKIDVVNKIKDALISGVDGGEYYDETLTIKLINLVQNGSFEDMSNWTTWLTSSTDSSQKKYGKHSLKLGGDTLNGDALASTAIEKPIAGHKYYGREYLKTNGELTAADCRFEIISTDIVPEEAHIFGWNQGNYPDWTMISDVITIPYANADSYIVRTFTVGGSVEAWVDGLMVIDLTATFGEGNEPSKEWCDTNIPFFEGGKKAYIDFNNSIRFISDLHKITILGEKFNLRANVTIEGIKYNDENKEIYVPDRTIIKCEVSGAYSIGANDSGTGLIIINGEEVVSAYGCTKTYDYIVKDDLTIRLDENGGLSSSSYGMITIDEENVGHIHFYGDWVFDNETYHSKTCVCGDVISEKHDWDEGVVAVQATHTETGIKTYTCSVCKAEKTEIIPAYVDDHTFGKWTKVDDNKHSRECACGKTETADHSWNDGVVTTQPTTTAGIMTYTCSTCGCTKTENIPPIESPVLAAGQEWYTRGSITILMGITTINFVDLYTPTGAETKSWAADVNQNGAIMCYLNEKTLIVAGNGTGMIMANPNSSKMFSSLYFYNLSTINGLDILNTSQVIDMSVMFGALTYLKKIDVSNWNTSNVTNMSRMFYETAIETLDVSNWNTSNVTNMSQMFYLSPLLSTLRLSNWDTNNVISMDRMFMDCSNLTTLDISGWNTSNVTNMDGMFYRCPNLITIYASDGFVTNKVTTSLNMFTESKNIVGGNGTAYDSNYIDATYARIDTVDTPGYFTDPSRIFTFSVVSTSGNTLSYNAKQGMTWDEFIDSEYNIGDETLIRHSVTSDGITTYYPAVNDSWNCIDIREKGTTVLKTSVYINDIIVELDDTEEYYAHYATCLTGDTQVLTSLDGEQKKIQEFQTGDVVVSYNLTTGEDYLAKVTHLVVNENSISMAKVTLENGTVLNMTTEHPILTKNGFSSVYAWGDYFELALGDEVKTNDGWSVITMIEKYILDEPVCTYTLGVVDYNEDPDVDIYDNFYANGVVVHNKIF